MVDGIKLTCKSILGAEDLTKFLKEVGVDAEKSNVDALIAAVNGRKFHEIVKEGQPRLASVSGGSGPAAASAGAAGGAPAAEEKKEEKVEEEANVEMGGLFGDDEEDY